MLSLRPIRNSCDVHRSSELDRFFSDPFFRFLDDSPVTRSEWKPIVEVSETVNDLVFHVEVPGIEQKDLAISVDDGLLTFSGERAVEREEGRELVYRERLYGKFSRSFRLPKTADVEKIEASLSAGVLKIRVPKKEEAKPKRVEVKVS